MDTARTVVASVLTHLGSVCLLQRSARVSWDAGLWHCITGYLPDDTDPLEQARAEVLEEAGVGGHLLSCVTDCGSLEIPDADGMTWLVHVYSMEVAAKAIRLNWENQAYRWISINEPIRVACVAWLPLVLDRATGLNDP